MMILMGFISIVYIFSVCFSTLDGLSGGYQPLALGEEIIHRQAFQSHYTKLSLAKNNIYRKDHV